MHHDNSTLNRALAQQSAWQIRGSDSALRWYEPLNSFSAMPRTEEQLVPCVCVQLETTGSNVFKGVLQLSTCNLGPYVNILKVG